jgi:hypothetical protein
VLLIVACCATLWCGVQVETEEDETTIEDLRALTRVFVPEQVQEDFAEVRQYQASIEAEP